jgi:hypothetical protein
MQHPIHKVYILCVCVNIRSNEIRSPPFFKLYTQQQEHACYLIEAYRHFIK